jgi:hypothetical protein
MGYLRQDDNQVFFQKLQQKFVKIDWLNSDELKIDEVQGWLLDGTYNETNDNPERRNCSIKMAMFDDRFIPKFDGYVWLNRKFRLWLGIKNIITDEIKWFNKGLFMLNKPSLYLDNTQRVIELQGLDYACKCNGTLGGQLLRKTKFSVGTPIGEVLKASVGLAGYTKFNLDENDITLPYDIEKGAENNIWEIVNEIVGLYKGYEAFFDANGCFTFQKIKDRKSDSIAWTFNTSDLTINYRNEPDFTNIKNEVVVYGRELENGTQIMSTKQNTDEKNPFSIPSIDKISITYSNDKIFTQEQSDLWSKYYLEQHSNLAEKISINVIPILNLETNKVVEFNDDNGIGIEGRYLIDRISNGLRYDTTMQIDLHKLYV